MKQWIINWLKIGIKVLIVAAVALTVFYGATLFFRYEGNTRGDDFRSLPENSMDVLVFGSSQVQYGFNPAFFKQMSGLNSYVLGSGCQNMSVTLAYMKDAFETQSPSYIIVDVYTMTDTAYNMCYSDEMVYDGANNIKNSEYRNEALNGIKESGSDKYYEYLYDLVITHDKWKTTTLDDIQAYLNKDTNNTGDYSTFGYITKDMERVFDYTHVYIYDETEVSEPTDLQKSYIDQMIELCNQHDCQLILVKVPTDISQSDQALVRGILQYGQQQGALTYNMIDNASDMDWYLGRDGDTFHSNVKGSYSITYALYELISQQGSVTANNAFSELDEIYKKYALRCAMNIFQNYDNIYTLVDMIEYLGIPTVLYYNPDEVTLSDSDLQMLVNLGYDFDGESTYYAILDDSGTVIASSSEFIDITYQGVSIQVSDGIIAYDGAQYTIDTSFALMSFNYNEHSMALLPVDLDNQYYFWITYCYDKACELPSY